MIAIIIAGITKQHRTKTCAHSLGTDLRLYALTSHVVLPDNPNSDPFLTLHGVLNLVNSQNTEYSTRGAEGFRA